MSEPFSIRGTLGLLFPVLCGVCRGRFDRHIDHPVTGRCGHTVCAKCHHDFVSCNTVNPSRWQPCPIGSCSNLHSFEIAGPPTGAVMQAVEYATAVEEGVRDYISQTSCEVRMAKLRQKHKEELRAANLQNCQDLEDMRKLYNSAAEANRKELREKEDTILQLQKTIDGLRAELPEPPDPSSPESSLGDDVRAKTQALVDSLLGQETTFSPDSCSSSPPSPAPKKKKKKTNPLPSSPSPPPSPTPKKKKKKTRLQDVKRRFRLNPNPKRVSTSPQINHRAFAGDESTPEAEF